MANQPKFTRRSSLGLLGVGGVTLAASLSGGCSPSKNQQVQNWNGDALGAPASIALHGVSKRRAKKLFALALTEIERLESLFSLYQPSSEISRLNKNGVLENASVELIDILRISREMADLTDGAFDITVQPLWDLATRIERESIPQSQHADLWAKARGLVEYRGIKISGKRIFFTQQNMAITLNGLAQGYITDKVCAVLQKHGAPSGLVNIGEHRAFGKRIYRVDIQDPRNVLDILDTFLLHDHGLATSSPKGGYIHEGVSHIFPAAQVQEKPHMSVSVAHKQAVIADALATAFVHMPLRAIRKTKRKIGSITVLFVDAEGGLIRL